MNESYVRVNEALLQCGKAISISSNLPGLKGRKYYKSYNDIKSLYDLSNQLILNMKSKLINLYMISMI